MQAIKTRSGKDFQISTAANKFSPPFFAAGMLPECRVSVVVPVRDEARNLPDALRALTHQVDFENRPLDPKQFEIIVLANNCQDDSATIARRFAQKPNSPRLNVCEIAFPRPEANVGHARRFAMEIAFARFNANANQPRGIIATTDGDTLVAPDWIQAIKHEIGRGADAVSGRISLGKHELARLDPATRAYHLRDTGYRLLVAELEAFLDPLAHDGAPRHFQHFNASFAVTCQAYQRAGGVPQVEFLEDSAFYQELLKIDARFRHSPLVRVSTSARRAGRAACGLSTQLQQWALMGENAEPWKVAGLRELETEFSARRALRRSWQRAKADNYQPFAEVARLAKVWRVPAGWLTRQIFEAATFGRLRCAIERERALRGAWNRDFPSVDVQTAIKDLRLRLNELRAAKTT